MKWAEKEEKALATKERKKKKLEKIPEKLPDDLLRTIPEEQERHHIPDTLEPITEDDVPPWTIEVGKIMAFMRRKYGVAIKFKDAVDAYKSFNEDKKDSDEISDEMLEKMMGEPDGENHPDPPKPNLPHKEKVSVLSEDTPSDTAQLF
jgi:hypothetical protein